MGWFKTKIRPADAKFSIFIRTRDNWRCQYKFKCGGRINFITNKGGLQASHFQKRRKESVRFDPENVDAVCIKCHYFVENDPAGQSKLEKWKEKQLGEHRYKMLMLRANVVGMGERKDDAMQLIKITALMKTI